MTFGAGGLDMGARQRKAGFVVIKCCRIPSHCRVTGHTILIKSAGNMVGIDNTGIIGLVTTVTRRRHPFVLTVLMTEKTVGGHVGAGERKACRRMIEC